MSNKPAAAGARAAGDDSSFWLGSSGAAGIANMAPIAAAIAVTTIVAAIVCLIDGADAAAPGGSVAGVDSVAMERSSPTFQNGFTKS
jgi:hypothetical protein